MPKSKRYHLSVHALVEIDSVKIDNPVGEMHFLWDNRRICHGVALRQHWHKRHCHRKHHNCNLIPVGSCTPQYVYISLLFILFSIGAFRLYHIIVDTRLDVLAFVFTIPSF